MRDISLVFVAAEQQVQLPGDLFVDVAIPKESEDVDPISSRALH